MDKIKRERFRKIRGLILYCLVRSYPAPLDYFEIRCFLDDLNYTITEEELLFHLAYLKDGKLVEIEMRGRDDIKRELVRATRDGINVRDGRLQDIGIDMENIP